MSTTRTTPELGRRSSAWVSNADRLLRAYSDGSDIGPRLRRKLESLRHKRDTAVTKQVALAHHALMGREEALEELERATRQLGDAWRAVVTDLARDPLELDSKENEQ